MEQLKQEEAKRLLEMLKYTLTNEINFPEKGMAKEFSSRYGDYSPYPYTKPYVRY